MHSSPSPDTWRHQSFAADLFAETTCAELDTGASRSVRWIDGPVPGSLLTLTVLLAGLLALV